MQKSHKPYTAPALRLHLRLLSRLPLCLSMPKGEGGGDDDVDEDDVLSKRRMATSQSEQWSSKGLW